MTLPYIINAALVLATCLAFYKVLLRRETFYRVNRYMLVICLVISFTLPLLQVPAQFSFRKKAAEGITTVQQPATNKTGPVQQAQAIKPPAAANNPTVNGPATETTTSSDRSSSSTKFSFSQLMNWIILIYWFGVIIFAASFLFQAGILVYRSFKYPVISDGPYRIVEVTGDKAPCSFGNIIFINPEKYEWDTYNQILLHEKIHIRQKHTIDILFAELVLIFQWFNPFAWIYRREIESNLEFLTDDQLMQQDEVDKKTYQLSLVKVSAPHFPLSLTTNYNQSILKKRIAMMNRKRSNLHTAWKYFFLMPVLAFIACLLNEPVAKSQTNESKNRHHGIETEGYWFAIIKDDKVNIRFSDEKIDSDEDDFRSGHSYNSSTFKLSELGTLPNGTSGSFNISREAGRMEMTGKFEGNTGMGRYKFVADKSFSDYMSKELNEKLDTEDEMAFFFINIRKDYLQTLRSEGFTKITKDELIPMAALKVDAAYIRSIKNSGFKDVSSENLVSLKALGVDDRYINEIRSAGYKNVTTDQLVSFKAQGIDKEYITKVRKLKGNDGKEADDDADDIVSFKAMGIDEDYINSFKAVGLTNIPNEQLVSFKAVGVTPEYIKSWQDMGFKDINPEDYVGMKSQNVTPEFMKSFTDLGYKEVKPENLVAFKALNITPEYIKGWQALGFRDIDLDEFTGMKSQNVTPEYMKSFTNMGYKDVKPENLVSFKALGITPEWIRSFEAIGYKNIDLDELPALKSQNITPEFIKSFEAMGFKNIKIDEIVSVKATGVTPEYIKDMKAKGFNYNTLEKYVRLKTID
ncbi:MAG TPA: M56 family metallopeptidase [Chitinophagaceae bacterium]|nr:M56 family metallopeptidase [Chitinophagaceae bacterium]